MKLTSRFNFSKSWLVLLKDMQIDPSDVLTFAKLPADLFNQTEIVLGTSEYYRLWMGLEKAAGEKELALLLAENLSVESFDPVIFACLCSDNLNKALDRLRVYKPLVAPMKLSLNVTSRKTILQVECYGYEATVPKSIGVLELAFFTQLSRIATRHQIVPISVQLSELPNNIAPYEQFFSCTPVVGQCVEIQFDALDATRPFLTSNANMWSFFESQLNTRLKDLTHSATTVDRVSAVLLEALPAGENSMDHVAGKLTMSKRTMQRKLSDESETFQSVLQKTRTRLADHYLRKSQLSLAEISFLLGFQEPNSFIRAYSGWKGVSPGQFRESNV